MGSYLSRKSTSTGGAHRVVVFSTPTCHWCGIAKNYLRSKNISFVEHDVSRDRAAAQAMVRRTGQMGVPVIEIDGQSIVGFDQARIDHALGLPAN
jgi:glutaredoxin 3